MDCVKRDLLINRDESEILSEKARKLKENKSGSRKLAIKRGKACESVKTSGKRVSNTLVLYQFDTSGILLGGTGRLTILLQRTPRAKCPRTVLKEVRHSFYCTDEKFGIFVLFETFLKQNFLLSIRCLDVVLFFKETRFY